MNFKTCTSCKEEKILNIENFQWREKRQVWEAQCKNCKSNNNKKYYILNKFKIIKNVTNYYEENKELKKKYGKDYYEENKRLPEFIKVRKTYNENNKKSLSLYRNEYWKNRRKTDINYRLERNISNAIYKILKNNKANLSVKNYLPYTAEELKKHLESQFKSWMTWDNWGVYNLKTWDDNDSSTWTWQIDHIIPKISFTYNSMEDDNFKKCWGLNNLQPLSSKENIIKGDTYIENEG